MTSSPLQARHRARCRAWVQRLVAPMLPAGRSRSSSIDGRHGGHVSRAQGETVMGQRRRLLGEETPEMGLAGCRWVGSGAMDEKGLQTSIPEGAWNVLLQSEGADHMWASWSNIPLQPCGKDRHVDIISFPVCLVCNNSHPNQWQQRVRHHGDSREGSGL